MGLTYADIELISGADLADHRRGMIGDDEIKRITVNTLVDTGCMYLAINENIQDYLKLPIIGTKAGQLANGEAIKCNVVGPVELRFKNRECLCSAIVLPGDSEPLLGLIPMEEMDILIHPQRQELVVNPEHPDFAVAKMTTLLPPGYRSNRDYIKGY